MISSASLAYTAPRQAVLHGSPSTDTVSCVLQAAQEVFFQTGFRASIDAVATRAGVARQTIYNNFSNKRNLFSRAIEHGMENLLIELASDESEPMPVQLEAFARKLRARVLTPQSSHLYSMLSSEASRFPHEARDFFEKAFIAPRQHFAQMLSAFMQAGLLREEDALEAANFFFDTLLGIDLDRLHFSGDLPDPELEADLIRKHVQRFLRVYCAD